MADTADIGLSPRGRGNHAHLPMPRLRQGSIPAWAGEPSSQPHNAGSGRVYPRVGGGTASGLARGRNAAGLSPRGRGNPHLSTSC